eukprot:CAMPEP_0184503284 /NCGR_PEP_ID=MMETSP0113_2-20130426/51802_1 /TAXON_ID=91329 /ORGANISM="Norrisiella sphaerica, Strain BC52" /LENGTH=389 /DNA_ID=CAMNT_0026892755 /DNA_START=104 /DNA_END=1273 /DNA_ORIENTATION=-
MKALNPLVARSRRCHASPGTIEDSDMKSRIEALEKYVAHLEAENIALKNRVNQGTPAQAKLDISDPLHHSRHPKVQTPDRHEEDADFPSMPPPPQTSATAKTTSLPPQETPSTATSQIASSHAPPSSPPAESIRNAKPPPPPPAISAKPKTSEIPRRISRRELKPKDKNGSVAPKLTPDRTAAWGHLRAEKEKLEEEMRRQKEVEEKSRELIRIQKNRERLMRNMPTKPPHRDTISLSSSPESRGDQMKSPSHEAVTAHPGASLKAGVKPFKPANEDWREKKIPTSGIYGNLEFPLMRYQQTLRDVDVTVYIRGGRDVRHKHQLTVDFLEDEFIVKMNGKDIVGRAKLGGKIRPIHCGWEWYISQPYEVKIIYLKLILDLVLEISIHKK